MFKLLLVILFFSSLLQGCGKSKLEISINSGSTPGSNVSNSASSNTGFLLQFGTSFVNGDSSFNDVAYRMVQDSNQNMILAGYTRGDLFEENADAANTSVDLFIISLTKNGQFNWGKQYGDVTIGSGASGIDQVLDVVVDSSDNIYVAGITQGSLFETYGGGNGDGFIFKTDSSGTILWSHQFGSDTYGASSNFKDQIRNLAIYNNKLYFAGNTTGTLFGGTNPSAHTNIIIGTMNLSNGTLTDFVHLDDATMSVSSINELVLDMLVNVNGVYISSNVMSTVFETFGGFVDPIILRVDHNLDFEWGKQYGDTTWGALADKSSNFNQLVGASDGSIYTCGATHADLYETNLGLYKYDLFIQKLDATGTIQWGKQIGQTSGGANSGNDETCLDIHLYNESTLYVIGQTRESLFETNGNIGTYDIIFLKLDESDGTIIENKQYGYDSLGSNADNDEYPYGSFIDSDQNIYMSGSTGGNFADTLNGTTDIFVLKLGQDGTIDFSIP